MAAGILIATVIALIFIAIWFKQSYRIKKLVDKFPGPPALPLIGNAHILKRDGAGFYSQVLDFCKVYPGGGFRLWLGPKPTMAFYKANVIEPLLNSTKHMDKSAEYDFLHPWLGTGLLTSTGLKWHQRRKLLTPTFHFKILSDFLEVFNEQSKIFVYQLRNQTEKDIDLFPFITKCALDIICDTAMGKHVNAQGNPESKYVEAVYLMSEIVHRRQKAPWHWPDILFNTIGRGKEHDKCLEILHGFTEKVIQERQAEHKQYSDDISSENIDEKLGKHKRLAFLDMLLFAQKEAGLTFTDIREEVDTFMFEGHDTTAAGMAWASHLIGSHPDVQQKLHDEMDSIFGESERMPSKDDLTKMKYLEYCIKESLRLFPSVPMFARTITEDIEIDGKIVPKDTTAVIVTSALHRDPKYFPDPEKFDPERFTPENANGRHPYAYVPFSAGMRNCIGQKFAMMEEKVILSSLLRNYSIKSVQRRDEIRPLGELILRPDSGIRVRLTARK
ncbi:unnamed protein product [Owenia fusiformis]|uniref:Cytochrome P450 n=1 Tax=Owenia fusiformis TaxID=6347 RepID=A0A8S4PJ12_OWEFU|nr:unnamed protein product [Owenia fusiformis]